jgi:hypothetical protein
VAIPFGIETKFIPKCLSGPANEVTCLVFQIIRDETVRLVKTLTTGMEPFSGPGAPDNEHIPQLRVCGCRLDLQQVAIVRFRKQQTSYYAYPVNADTHYI